MTYCCVDNRKLHDEQLELLPRDNAERTTLLASPRLSVSTEDCTTTLASECYYRSSSSPPSSPVSKERELDDGKLLMVREGSDLIQSVGPSTEVR